VRIPSPSAASPLQLHARMSSVVLKISETSYAWKLEEGREQITAAELKEDIKEQCSGFLYHEKLRFLHPQGFVVEDFEAVPLAPASVRVVGPDSVVRMLELALRGSHEKPRAAVDLEEVAGGSHEKAQAGVNLEEDPALLGARRHNSAKGLLTQAQPRSVRTGLVARSGLAQQSPSASPLTFPRPGGSSGPRLRSSFAPTARIGLASSSVTAASSTSLDVECGNASAELRCGQRVQVIGLQSRPELNGAVGRLVEFVESRAKWQVALDAGMGEKLLKAVNLVAIEDSEDGEEREEAQDLGDEDFFAALQASRELAEADEAAQLLWALEESAREAEQAQARAEEEEAPAENEVELSRASSGESAGKKSQVSSEQSRSTCVPGSDAGGARLGSSDEEGFAWDSEEEDEDESDDDGPPPLEPIPNSEE